jgi:hypothetical protein
MSVDIVKPIDACLIVPFNLDGTPAYDKTLGASCVWDITTNKFTLSAEDWEDFFELNHESYTALVSFPRYYMARTLNQLLPAEVRRLTSSSADVMSMLTRKEPTLADRLTENIMSKLASSGGNDKIDIGTTLEAALNIELTLKHPELLVEIEEIQASQPAIQLAVMLGGDVEFFTTLHRYVPEGSHMINELLSIIDPPVILKPSTPTEDDVPLIDTHKTLEAVVEPMSSALADTLANDDVDDEYDDEYEDDEYEDEPGSGVEAVEQA